MVDNSLRPLGLTDEAPKWRGELQMPTYRRKTQPCTRTALNSLCRLPALSLTVWLTSSVLGACAGPQGEQGLTGPQGEQGEQGPSGTDVPARPVRLLDDKIGRWLPENRSRLNGLVESLGIASATFDPKNRPVAVFDWDNTLVKNDLGDATLFWMLQHDKILQPSEKDWGTTSRHLTAAAKAALNSACDTAANPGQPLPTRTLAACADEIVSIYNQGKTKAGQQAWNNAITLTLNTAYAWVAQLQAGYTPEELRAFARSAYAENAFNPPGTTQTVGTTSGLAYHVQVYEEMIDLIEVMQANGFDVWVATASPQFVIDAVSEELVGIKPNRVIGIRSMTDAQGRVVPRFQGCGSVADGEDSLITYDQGKRCWLNKLVFRVPAEQQLARQQDERKRHVFAAGDSDTDLAFVQDATHLKLAINRNKVQLMCNAYANLQSKWLVQPMFVQPRAKGANYPCTTALDAAGQPIVDEAGSRFAQDYEDRTFALP